MHIAFDIIEFFKSETVFPKHFGTRTQFVNLFFSDRNVISHQFFNPTNGGG